MSRRSVTRRHCRETLTPRTIWSWSTVTDDVASFVARLCAENGCDGLFLPAVDHLGVRIPVRAIVEPVRNTSHLQFVLVDAAQAFCQVTIDDSLAVADFVVTGCHKWMRAGQPMGVGFFGRNGTQRIIRETLQENSGDGSDLDPLLIFTEQLDGGQLNSHSETVNLAPLFSSSAAAVEQLRRRNLFSANAEDSFLFDNPVGFTMLDLPAELSHWIPIRPHETMRSRITLFSNQDAVRTSNSAEEVRREWLNHGCVVTSYDNGGVRLSPPQELLMTSPVPMHALRVPPPKCIVPVDSLSLNRYALAPPSISQPAIATQCFASFGGHESFP